VAGSPEVMAPLFGNDWNSCSDISEGGGIGSKLVECDISPSFPGHRFSEGRAV